MESYNIGTRQLLGSLFCHHQKYQKYHYRITLPQLNPNSLSEFLLLDKGEYNALLNELGLATLSKDGMSLRIKPSAWELLIIQEGLKNCYFDKMNMHKMPSFNNEDNAPQYLGYWIRVCDNGLFSGIGKKLPNSSSQFLVYQRPHELCIKIPHIPLSLECLHYLFN
jgi:hypothetical protein